MDSQPSGNNKELIFIETDEIYFTIKGNENSVGYSEEKSLEVRSINNIINSEYDEYIHFKEYKNYEIIIEAKNEVKIEFYHDNINVRNKVTPTGRSGKMLSGIINFRGDIGYSDLYVFVNDEEHLKVTIEIFPSKIDYKDDYKELLRDVNEEIYNLAYGFLRSTYLGGELTNKSSNTYLNCPPSSRQGK